MRASIRRRRRWRILGTRAILLVFICLSLAPAAGAAEEGFLSAVQIEARYRVVPNIPYRGTAIPACVLDVIASTDPARPRPTVLYVHGGGWDGGSKESAFLSLLPFLERGFNAVNVEYRLAGVAPAPAAVEDVRCAMRWVQRHAAAHGFDVDRLVLAGHSAGGHLSLLAALVRPADGFDGGCPGDEPLRLAAVVNFFGVTDVSDLLDGAHQRAFARRWVTGPQATALARRLSPIGYVRASSGPVIITVHGDADPIVPFEHAERLHRLLAEAGATHRLIRVEGGSHGQFPDEKLAEIYASIFATLALP